MRIERQNVPENVLFQQFGVSAHASREAQTLLQHLFVENWVRKHGAVSWPPRPPDLSLPDFFH